MQFDFMPGWGNIDVIFILGQLQEKYLQKKKNINFSFVDSQRLSIVYHFAEFLRGQRVGNAET